eukprot:580555_1
MRLGASVEDSRILLKWKVLKHRQTSETFGGGWIVVRKEKTMRMPRKKQFCLILIVRDENQSIKNSITEIKCRIHDVPADQCNVPYGALLIIKPNGAHIKRFQEEHSIYTNYKHIQVIPPTEIRIYEAEALQMSQSPQKTQTPPEPSIRKPRKVTLDDLSSPESSVSQNDEPINARTPTLSYSPVPNPPSLSPPTNQELLKATLGIEDTLAIAYDRGGKILYNYAVQQFETTPSESDPSTSPLENRSSPYGSNTSLTLSASTPSSSTSSSRKRRSSGDDDTIGKEDSCKTVCSAPVEGPPKKKHKPMIAKALSDPTGWISPSKQSKKSDHHKIDIGTKIYVVDLETTSFPPRIASAEAGDVVIEIGIVQFERREKRMYTIKPVFHCFINPESYDYYPENWKDAWIFRNGTSVDMVQTASLSAKIILPEIRRILKGNFVTSYNTDFDLKRFLLEEPYSVDIKEFDCIMELATKQIGFRSTLETAAYHFLGFDYVANFHNAMEDA